MTLSSIPLPRAQYSSAKARAAGRLPLVIGTYDDRSANSWVAAKTATNDLITSESLKASKIALIGTFPPRKCGIATFTDDVRASIVEAFPAAEIDIYAITRKSLDVQYGNAVRATINEGERASFAAVARDINRSNADVVWIQHEFGLYGGFGGDNILALVEAVAAPVIVTLHTVLSHPDADQLRVMQRLVARASRLVVMSAAGRKLLLDFYGADSEQVALIEHGVPDRPFGRTALFKQKLGLDGHNVLMTFGLLSPGKGIENVVTALPDIVSQFPDTLYCIVGATHPNLFESEGERYRDQLKQQIDALGMSNHVRWFDAFFDLPDLLDLIEAADIYVTPYPGAGQSTSGTLSYAVALGKAVVSTPYIHACELLDDGHGVLVPFNDGHAIAVAVNGLLSNPNELRALQQRAYLRGREMLWSTFAARSMDLVRQAGVANTATQRERAFVAAKTPLGFDGIRGFSDDTGMFQHSSYAVPDRNHGYCIDDNARALMLMHYVPMHQQNEADRLALIYAAFVNHAWNADAGHFRNFMGYDRCWLEDVGSEDSNARTLWALGCTISDARDEGLRAWATSLFERAVKSALRFDSPRALAFAALAALKILEVRPQDIVSLAVVDRAGDRLGAALAGTRRADWTWFETVLAYDNCRLPEALLRMGHALDRPEYIACGIETLDWIIKQQTGDNGHFRPVGSDSFNRDHSAALPFDQQPVEAWAAIDVCDAAFQATGDRRWLGIATDAYAWFFGANDRGVALADAARGICHDGVTARGLNANQGAESILALHLASASLGRLMKRAGETDAAPAPQQPVDASTKIDG